MKRIIITLFAIFATLAVSAQDLRWGATGGLNFAWAHATEKNSSDCYIGFQLGVMAEMDFSDVLTDGFYLDGRLVYTLKGGAWEGFHQNLGYLEIPVNLGYRYHLGDDISLIAGLGPYFGLGILGKSVIEEGGSKVKTDLFGNAYKRFDFGLNYKVGVEMWENWQFFLGFEHSLMRINKTNFDEEYGGYKLRPLNFYIGTAYMF